MVAFHFLKHWQFQFISQYFVEILRIYSWILTKNQAAGSVLVTAPSTLTVIQFTWHMLKNVLSKWIQLCDRRYDKFLKASCERNKHCYELQSFKLNLRADFNSPSKGCHILSSLLGITIISNDRDMHDIIWFFKEFHFEIPLNHRYPSTYGKGKK